HDRTCSTAAVAAAATAVAAAAVASATAAARDLDSLALVTAHVLADGLVGRHWNPLADGACGGTGFGLRDLNCIGLRNHLSVRNHDGIRLLNLFGVRHVDR